MSKEDAFRLAMEETDRIKKLSPEKAFEAVQSIVAEYKKEQFEALPKEISLFPFLKTAKSEPFALGAERHYLGFEPTYNVTPEPSDIFVNPQQPTRLSLGAKPTGIREVAPQEPELWASSETGFRLTPEYEKRLGVAKAARLIREEANPGDHIAGIVEGFLPTPPNFKPIGFDEGFPVHRLGGHLARILLLGKAAAAKGVATETAKAVHAAAPWITGKAATVPIVSQIMNYDLPATIASKILYSEWFPAVVGNAVERGLVWSADAFIEKLGRTGSLKEAAKAGAIAAPFGMARGAVHVLPFQGVSAPSEAAKIGLQGMFGTPVMEKVVPPALKFGADVLPAILAGGLGAAETTIKGYWEQGDKFKKTALKEAMFAFAWSGFIEAVGHKHLVEEWRRFNIDQYLWDKATAFADSALQGVKPDGTILTDYEATRILAYRNYKFDLSPAAHSKMVYEQVMKETIPRQFSFLSPDKLSQIQVELANRVIGGENAVNAFGDIMSQFLHVIKDVRMPLSEVEIPGMVLPTKYRTDFAELLRQQIIESERVPLHPPKDAKTIQDDVIQKLKAKYPEYDMEKAIDEAQAKLPPKYHTAFAEALQRRLKLSEAVPLHPAEIGRDAERVAEEVSEMQEEAISKFEGMSWRQFTEGITPEEQKELAKVSKKLEPLAYPVIPEKPKGKTAFQEYMERGRVLSAEPAKPIEPAAKPEKISEEPEHIKLRRHANKLQRQLEKKGYDYEFFNTVIKEGKSYSANKPNAMSNDEIKGAIRRMQGYLETTATTKAPTRKEQKRIAHDKAIRAKIFQKLPEKPTVDLYNQVKEQFKDYKPETAHVFDWIRGVRHVFRRDKLLHDYGFKPLHDAAMLREHFIVDEVRPARATAKEIGVGKPDRQMVTHYRNLKWLKMVNPERYKGVVLPELTEKQAKWDAYLTKEYEKLAKIFKPQNLLPFDVYSPILFDDTADDPEMEILGTFYPEGVPKNIEAFFMKKRVNKDIKDKIFDDSLVLLERYIRSGSKVYFLKDHAKRIRKDLLSDKHINDSMRKLLQSYTERVLGYPTVMDEFVGHTFATAINFMGRPVGFKREYTAEDTANLAHTFINLTYMSAMGLRPMPVLKNLTQSLNTACELGPTWVASGVIDFLFKGWGEAEHAGVIMEYAPEIYGEYEEENSFDRLRDIMLMGFQAADKINRSIAYYSALNKYDTYTKIFKDPTKFKRFLLSHHLDERKREEVIDALDKGYPAKARHLFAEEIVAKTQYLYNKYDSPLITRTSLGKMFFQFSSWPENYVELMLDWGRNKNYAAFLRMTATALALGYIAKQTDKKWLKKFIYSIQPLAPLPLTEWKLHRYAIPPSLEPVENLLYISGDLVNLVRMQDDPEKFAKQLPKDLKKLMLATIMWTPGGMLAKDIYRWSNIPMEKTGEPAYPVQRPSINRNMGLSGQQRPSIPRR